MSYTHFDTFFFVVALYVVMYIKQYFLVGRLKYKKKKQQKTEENHNKKNETKCVERHIHARKTI